MSVHSAHCCAKCGCKYRDECCPVVLGIEYADYECGRCTSEKKLIEKIMDAAGCSHGEAVCVIALVRDHDVDEDWFF